MKFGNHNWERSDKVALSIHNTLYKVWYCDKCNTVAISMSDEIIEWAPYTKTKYEAFDWHDGPPSSCEEVRMEDALT